ncbi:MAG: D-aminoacyl-tRNA deacylase [Candidatus Dependentiae bacterium]
MRAIIQRVKKASVTVNNEAVAGIDKGLLVFIGIAHNDTVADRAYLINKIVKLRIFEDLDGNMNRSITDVEGEILLVSQFTLYGDVKKGNRPSFIQAMKPDEAKNFYQQFVVEFQSEYVKVETGIFQADMDVALINSGPVTILIDSHKSI